MPRTKRERLATGIYRDARGVAVVAHVNGRQEEHRFPRGTPLQKLIAAREAMRVDLRRSDEQQDASRPVAGTLSADVSRYLATVRTMASYRDRERDINRWVAVFGKFQRRDITSTMVRKQLQDWHSAGDAAQTCDLRRTALMHLYNTLDGREAYNPVRGVPKLQRAYDDPRAIPPLAVAKVLRTMRRGGKTRARLAVMATTGMTQREMTRLRPEDIDFETGVVLARARRKGKGAPPRAIPMTRHARLALRAFVQVDAFGTFSVCSMHKNFRVACERAGFEGTDWRPYDLRHTFGTAFAEASGDERAVAEVMGHTPGSTMTRRYTLKSLSPRVAKGIAALDRRPSRGPKLVVDNRSRSGSVVQDRPRDRRVV